MPYDDLGNYIPGDENELDKMRYELSLADTVRQMIKSPANDLSGLTKPQTYKDIAAGLGSAGESMVRGAGAAAFGFPGDILKHFQETPLIPGVTDKISMGDVFPGYDTVKEAVAPTPFALPQRVPPNMSVAPERPKQEVFGLPYATTGDILEAAPSRYTAQFGDKEANDFMEGLGMFLSPQMAAGARKGIINMVETTGKMPSLTADSAQAFARDYANAMNGVYPETPTVGSMAADFARTGKAAARKTGEVVGETIEDIAQRRASGEGAYASPFSPQSMMADIVAGPRSYAVRPTNAGQLLKETDMPTIKYTEANPIIHTVGYRLEENILPYTGTEYPNTTRAEYYRHIFENDMDIHRAYDTWASKKYMEMFPDAPSVDVARRAYSNQGNLVDRSQDQMRMMSEFANSPEANTIMDQKATARDLAIEEYNELKNTPKDQLATDEAKDLHKARVQELELDLLKKDYAPELSSEEYRKRISIPTADEYLRRANAAKKYMLGEFRNDIAKYIGTSQGPQMELAKKGITIPEKRELMERAKQITQGGKDFRELQKKREAAGFNPLGEMQPLIVQKEAELAEQQKKLDELNTKQNELRQQHYLQMPEEPDPARNPTEIGAQYRALRNPMTSIIEKMAKNKKQLENFQLANAYETVSDMAYTEFPASDWRKKIPFEQRHFFPDLFNKRESGEFAIPEEAPMFTVAGPGMKHLGIEFLAERYTQAILDGRVPIDEKGKPTVSIEKFIEQITKPRLKEEELKDIEHSKSQVRLNDYAQRSLSSTSPDLRFENASAIELTQDNPLDVIRRQISFDGMVLDNCVAATDAPHPGINPFTNERYSYSYPVDPATGATRGDKVRNSSFMTAIHEGDQRYASLRDNQTGIPVVNINMIKTGSSTPTNPKYNVQYVSGYQNNKIDKKYTDDVRNYLNARADIIEGSGTGIDKWGIFDLKSNGGQTAASKALGVPSSALGAFDLPRFVTEKDLRDLAQQQPVGETHADLVAARGRLSEEMRQLINQYGAGAPEAQDVANQLQDIEARLNTISTQVRNAPDNMNRPSLFRRMTTEALTNGIGIEDGGIGPVRAMVDNVIDRDTYGLREFWSDDYDFYPTNLQRFTNAIRNGDNLPTTLTDVQDLTGFAPQMRERLARFQARIQDFTPMQRELLVRELDNYAESNINQLADNLDPDNPTAGLEQIEDNNPGTIQYLRDIETRRRGQDVQPEAQAPALQAPTTIAAPRYTPRDIALSVHGVPPENIEGLTDQIQTVITNLDITNQAGNRLRLEELRDAFSNPNNLPESIIDYTHDYPDLERISNYLVEHIDYRLANQAPQAAQLPAPRLPGNDYRDLYTNELTGSREAFDQIMEAERITPGAINEAITRTDGNARYDVDIQRQYHVESPAGIQQLNNALRQYMEGNGFDVPPRPAENAIAELERRYPDREEFVYEPEDMSSEIDYEMEGQERRLTRNQYGRLEDLVEEIQREAGEDFEDLIDAIDRMRMRQGVDGDVDAALGDIRARLIRSEEQARLEFDRLQRNAEERNRPAVVEPENALQGALDAAQNHYHPNLVEEMRSLVDNIQNDDIRFDREPTQFIARLRDEAAEYADHNAGYAAAVGEMADFLENYMRERAARPQGRKRGGFIKKMNDGGKIEPTSPSPNVNDQSKPHTPPKKIINPDAPEFKDLFNRERAIRGGGGGSGSPADLKQMMNPRNITYNAGGNVSVDQMRYELLRK